MQPLMTELLAEAVVEDRRRRVERHRLAQRSRRREAESTPAAPGRRLRTGPRDNRPRGRARRAAVRTQR